MTYHTIATKTGLKTGESQLISIDCIDGGSFVLQVERRRGEPIVVGSVDIRP